MGSWVDFLILITCQAMLATKVIQPTSKKRGEKEALILVIRAFSPGTNNSELKTLPFNTNWD
jgi:hypothetical protein